MPSYQKCLYCPLLLSIVCSLAYTLYFDGLVFTHQQVQQQQQQQQLQQQERHDRIPSDQTTIWNESNIIKYSRSPVLSSPSCRRKCPNGRQSMIFYCSGAAGMGDRISLLTRLAQWAGFLCAKVIMCPPFASLKTAHNNDTEVSNTAVWTDFVEPTFDDGNVSAFAILPDEIIMRIQDWRQVQHSNFFHDHSIDFSDWFHVVSSADGNDTTGRDFELIQNHSFQKRNESQKFFWEFRRNLWHSTLRYGLPAPPNISNVSTLSADAYDESMRPANRGRKSKGCIYTDPHCCPQKLKPVMDQLKTNILKQALPNATLVYFHLRRGDTITKCNTSISQISEFLPCSLNGTEELGRNITLLFATDEKEPEYRNAVADLVRPYHHVSLLDFDALAWQTVNDAVQRGIVTEAFQSNMHVFWLQKLATGLSFFCTCPEMQYLFFRLEKRRKRCPNCIRLVKGFAEHPEWMVANGKSFQQ